MRILPADAQHFPAILALNEASVAVLAPLTRSLLEQLHALAAYHRVVVDGGEVVAFALAVGSGAEHESVNYRWFTAAYPHFLYVDRVAVAAVRRREGVGELLYRDLFAFARRARYPLITCEIDAEPPNEASLRFHERFGFREVGRQLVEYVPGHVKRVSLRVAVAGAWI